MSQSIERNDVDLSKLFSWGKSFKILDQDNQEQLEVFVRLVGDEDLNKARVYGLRKSAELRKKLKTEDSDERLAFLPDKDFLDKDVLVEQIVYFRIKELASRALNEVQFNISKEPASTASLEEQENYQKLIDNFPEKRELQIRESIEKEVSKERDKLNTFEFEYLFKEYEKNLINQICENEMLTRFREMCTYYGTYSDSRFKNRLFKSLEDFTNLTTEVKNQLISFYTSLELTGEELKN